MQRNNSVTSVDNLKEMFASQLDPDVVELIFEQCNGNVELALGALFKITTDTGYGEKPAGHHSPDTQQPNRGANPFPTDGLNEFKDIYHSNEDLYHDDAPLETPRFPMTSSTGKPGHPAALDDDFSPAVHPEPGNIPTVDPRPLFTRTFPSTISPTRHVSPRQYPVQPTSSGLLPFPYPYVIQRPQPRWPSSVPSYAKMTENHRFQMPNLSQPPPGDSKFILNLVSRIKCGERIMILMRGCSGSGKSTMARSLNHGGVVLGTDDYFFDSRRNLYVFDHRGLSEAHQWNQNRAKRALEAKLSPIVIDNTNIEAWEMKPYVAMAVANKYSVELVQPETPWRYRVGQLYIRSVHNVPRKTIESTLDRFDHKITAAQLIQSVLENGASPAVRDVMEESNEGLSTLSRSTIEDINQSESGGVNGSLDGEIPTANCANDNPEDAADWSNPFQGKLVDISQSAIPMGDQTQPAQDEPRISWEMLSLSDKPIFQDTPQEDGPVVDLTSFDAISWNKIHDQNVDKSTFEIDNPDIFPGSCEQGRMDIREGDFKTAEDDTMTKAYSVQKPGRSRLACAFQSHGASIQPVPSQSPINSSESFLPGQECDRRVQESSNCSDNAVVPDANLESGDGEITSAFDIKKLFPSAPIESIEDLLKNCANDVQWAVNLLLDSGYTMAPEEDLQDESDIERGPLSPLPSEMPSDLPKPSSSNGTLTETKNLPRNLKDPDLLRHVDSDVVLQLDRVTALKLQELFGPVLCDLPSDSFAKDDLQVKITSEVAFAIHQCWMDTLAEKFDSTAAEMQAIINDQQTALELQASIDASSARQSLEFGCYSHFEIVSSLQPADVPEKLSEIMDLERALQQSKMKGNSVTKDDLATKIKRIRLYEMFPMVDKKALDEVFAAHNCSFPDTAKAVTLTFEPERRVETMYSEDHLLRVENEMVNKGIRDSLRDTGIAKYQSDEDDELLNNQALENPTYEDLRAEGHLHYRLHHECLQKAQEANRLQYKAVAAHYSRLGLLHYEKVKESHRLASEKILEMRNSNNDPNKLDLHMLHVKEALDALETFLTDRRSELVKGTRRKVEVYVVTGRGIHSRGGVGKIKQAVKKFLLSHKYKFIEINPGLIQITIARNSV